MRNLRAFPLALLFSALLLAQDTPEPDTPEQAAQEVLAILKAKDESGLKALADNDDPDPWLVADELCVRGEFAAAEAFAKAAPRTDTERLPHYVASYQAEPTPASLRQALAEADAAFAAAEPAQALDTLDGIESRNEDVVSVRILLVRGRALHSLRRFKEATECLRQAGELAERLGWIKGALWGYHRGGTSAYLGSAYRDAAELWKRRLALEEKRGQEFGVAQALGNLGVALTALGELRESLAVQERALKLKEKHNNRWGVAITLYNLGTLHNSLGNYRRAIPLIERSIEIREELGKGASATLSLRAIGFSYLRLADYEKAISYLERSAALARETGARQQEADTLGTLGLVYSDLGDYDQALRQHEHALQKKKEIDPRPSESIATTLGNMGVAHWKLANFSEAISCLTRSLEMHQRMECRVGVARALSNLGVVYSDLSLYQKALSYYERASRHYREMGDRHGLATAIGNMGNACKDMGDYPRGIAYYDQALKLYRATGDPHGVALALGNLGATYISLGDNERALSLQSEALKINQEIGSRPGIARALINLGFIHSERGDLERALEQLTSALALQEESGSDLEIADTLVNVASLREKRKQYQEALTNYERALRLFRKVGNPEGEARVLRDTAFVQIALGDLTKAEDLNERALAIAREIGDRVTVVRSLWNLVLIREAQGDHEGAADGAESALEQVSGLVGRVRGELGAMARERWSGLYDTAVHVALATRSSQRLCTAIERSRAGALMATLGGGEALRSATVPSELLVTERKSRERERVALTRYRRALKKKRRDEIKQRRAELTEARKRMSEATERIQLAAKAGTEFVHPAPVSVQELRGQLRPSEALVSFKTLSDSIVALIVTTTGARVQTIADSEKIFAAAARLQAGGLSQAPRSQDRPGESSQAKPDALTDIEELRKRLVDTLALGDDAERLLISPDGTLAYLPFAAIAPDREIVLLPSATTYVLLRAERRARGAAVLAVGEPLDYDANALSLLARRLPRLPGSRAEAESVGDHVLVGRAATEGGFRKALGRQRRWRAVHLACHALVDPQRPQFSGMVLAPDEKHDGLLTALDVFRLNIPADLVVLSACETARGRIYQAEGVFGFTRAFLGAGAPRVLASLWKVDDAATRALMVKFYELWNPKDGSTGLPTATALKKAQGFVRSHEKWKHPYYWAAWQLWGLAD